MTAEAVIRHATEADFPALSRICLETANAGKDATALYSDPALPGLRFVIPYARFAPDFALALEQQGEVVGYAVAVPDTRAFEAVLNQQWWPMLQAQYRDYPASAPLDSKVLEAIFQPDAAADQLVSQWPAHLHINLLPPAQQGGWGRKLIEQLLALLREAGVPGVHLGVSLQNEQVCGFYQRLGFTPIVRSNAIYMGQLL
ncbi:GNAT family N-acetyltransferase [Kosakonia radicincitans DSM 16656]|uniref:Ribosomal protein S18 acetylase RimI n=1 Tax=Kosakonia radicincitans TaxID=283686 RepID=A0AAX2EKZ2_9ENTR|nr:MULTISPECIES: GNAT family N-acetyltransferase [Kosakonia]MDP9565277.1 ribosomal protein S18 acetylase RimI-like enzyme [Kosakonia oryzae]APG16709.1 acetyltransferase [Kosakonia radicincitans]ARD62317.1 GNAT family N-acetyltransferase [Kosakonia radicincitans DSM 16656]MDD7993925.1 GNAT family N-acetyltransferase [Kosakonia radicincitans]NCF04939.1 GNAT family N-acetyltransferase [Kosakonia sp. MH5]